MSKMQKIANAFFIAIVSATLFSVIGYEAVQHIIPGLETPQKSYLEGREYQRFQKPTLETIANNNFQESFSKFVADDVPLRNKVIISNAALQQAAIQFASLPFGFEVYPTFFGSDYLYSPTKKRAYKMPLVQSADLSASINKARSVWSALIERHPDTRWFIYMPDRAPISLVNPGRNLINNAADRKYWEDEFFSKLPKSCTYVNGAYENAGKWDSDFFKSDHHWQIQGAFSAYQTLTKRLNVTSIEHAGFFETNSGKFWGSYARGGLCFSGESDRIWDIAYIPSALKVRINGKDANATSLDKGFYVPNTSYIAPAEYSNVYEGWFHVDYAHIEIENETAETDKTLLIIGDSFTSNIERLFAENYRSVYVVDPRHFTDDINQLISAIQPNDTLIMMSTNLADDYMLENIR